MKIAFAIKALANQGGGAERVLVDVASGLAARGHTVSIHSSDPVEALPYYPVDSRVTLVRHGIGDIEGASTPGEILRRSLALRRSLVAARPDVVVGFMQSTYLPLGLMLMGTGIPVIASEHIGPEHYSDRWLARLGLNLTPLVVSRITVVSRQIMLSFNGWLRRKMVPVSNPVGISAKAAAAIPSQGVGHTLLCVGRLAPQKDHAVLVSAFGMIAPQFPDWRLRIVGEGGLREALQAQIDALGLAGRVELAGATSQIDAEYAAADLFVLPSSYESFGLATAEALLHGLPAVGFADCPGTNDLIRNGENGRLVEGADRAGALATALAALMADPVERARLSSAPRARIIEQYGIQGVLDQWEAVCAGVAAAPARARTA